MTGKNKSLPEMGGATAKAGQHTKHVPTRMCVVCREKAGKRTLTRIVATPEGVMIDLTGKRNGRGAYLCEQKSCWERAVNTDLLAKALKTSLSAADRDRLQQQQPS
jgi:hypothetical protein